MKRLLIIIVVLLIVTAGAIALVAVFVNRDNGQQKGAEDQSVIASSVLQDQIQEQESVPVVSAVEAPRFEQLSSEDQKKRELEEIVTSFVERFGTYSNQTAGTRLASLKVFMSDRFYSWAVQNIATVFPSSDPSDLYYGITTQVLQVETTRLDEQAGEAEFRVRTQRNESRGSAANSRLYPQEAIARMYRNNGVWLVGAVEWQ